MTDIFDNVHKNIFEELCKIKIPPQFVITNNEQSMLTDLTFGDIFDHIKPNTSSKFPNKKFNHFHSENSKCCPHEESLYDHLLNAAKIAFIKSKELKYSEINCIKAYLTALFHDIGKPGTIFIREQISFKGHGIVGGAILHNLWTHEITDVFKLSKKDWGDICVCADVHMCGYFHDQKSQDHIFNIQILPISVKEMLIILRFADIMSLLNDKCVDIKYGLKWNSELEQQLNEEEEKYIDTIKDDINENDIIKYCQDKPKSCYIQLLGSSGSGKTTFADKLITMLGPDKVVYISRDFELINASHKVLQIPLLVSHKEITPSIYKTAYTFYSKNKSLSQIINSNMMKKAAIGLAEGKIVISDSLMHMYPNVRDQIIPPCVRDSYKINFWRNRNEFFDDENKMGITLEEQLKLHGYKHVFYPFHHIENWSKLISVTESYSCEELQQKLKDDYALAHLSINIGFNGCNDHVVEHIVGKLLMMHEYYKSIPRLPNIDQTMNLNLLDLVKLLNSINGIDSIIEFFTMYNFTINTKIPTVIGIKYIDVVCDTWKPKWARQARGRFYSVIGDKVIELKSGLQRGIEISLKVNDTKDINIDNKNDFTKYDDTQQYVLNAFSGKDNDIDGYVSSKVDGSLGIINIYPKSSEQYSIIKSLVFTNNFAKDICDYCITNDLPIVVISTQGTLFIGEDMQDYLLTSIDMDIYDFINKIILYYNELKYEKYISMYFELYCKNRTTNIGKRHTELAVGYSENGFKLLGINVDDIYIPHFKLPNIIFQQPLFYKISNINQIFKLLELLDSDDDVNKHSEGFIFLYDKGDNTFDYSKMKTLEYYICHNINDNNIKKILVMDEKYEKFFPIIKEIKTFFIGLKITLHHIINESYQKLEEQCQIDSILYKLLQPKQQQLFVKISDDKIRNNIFKMFLNTKDLNSELEKIMNPIIQTYFPNKVKSDTELFIFIKSLIMNIQPWITEWEKRLYSMIDNKDSTINILYNLIIGYH
jgi:hypothetical protein